MNDINNRLEEILRELKEIYTLIEDVSGKKADKEQSILEKRIIFTIGWSAVIIFIGGFLSMAFHFL